MASIHSLARTFTIGGELSVNRIGYGAMRLTGQPGNFGPYADWEGGKALLRRAVELGVNFIDTARAYGPLWNEKLIADALYPYPNGLVIATKGGIEKRGPTEIIRDGSPKALRRHVEEALVNLKLERIDLFQLHWVDPKTPLEESVMALEAMRKEGKIRFIGLSNITRDELERALAIAPIASVQNRYNQAELEHDALLDFTASQGIAFLPYGPLGAKPFEKHAPLASVPNGAQQALNWLLARSPNVIVIPGTASMQHLEENLATWTANGKRHV